MQTRALPFAALTIATILAAGNFAQADDTAKKQDATSTDSSKDDKSIRDAAQKVNLSQQISSLDFHGSVSVGYESTFGKGCHQSGMYSEFAIGKDFQLSKDVTMSVFVAAGHYPNSFLFR